MELAHNLVLDGMHGLVLPGMGEPAKASEDLRQRLHQHLDPELVIRCYARELSHRLRFTWLRYCHDDLALNVGRSNTPATQYTLRLNHQGGPIGRISYGFPHPLTSAELHRLNQLHRQLSQPLFVAWQFAGLKARLEQEPLTGLLNRSSFDRQLDERIEEAQQGTDTFTLLLMDLDHFKAVNDTHGHAAGDEVLRQVGKTLRGAIRPEDRAFRFGGDEFAILLAADSQVAERVAERLRRKIQALPELQRYGISCSIGFGEHQGEDDGARLFQRCDNALYQAKAAGRNCLVRH